MRCIGILLLGLVLVPGGALAQSRSQGGPVGSGWNDGPSERRFYDRSGRYEGRAESRPGGETRFYGADGRYQGRSEQRGGETHYWDGSGRYRGRSSSR